jgi:hypothetical protein
MLLKKVLKQARGNRSAEIRIGVSSPFSSEAPNLIRIHLNVIRNSDDRLPASISLAIRNFLAG